MGDTGRPADDDSGSIPEQETGPAWESYYWPLVRLAALLTSDLPTAEAVTADALAAVLLAAAARPAPGEPAADFLTRLQREVVARSRRARYYRKLAQRCPAGGKPAALGTAAEPVSEPDFSRLPVVQALHGLSARLREAIVLILYLDLPEARAAAVAGVTESALRANLAAALRALGDDQLTELCPGS